MISAANIKQMTTKKVIKKKRLEKPLHFRFKGSRCEPNLEQLQQPTRRVTIPAGLNYILVKEGEEMNLIDIVKLVQMGVLPGHCDPYRGMNQVAESKEERRARILNSIRDLEAPAQNEILATLLLELTKQRSDNVQFLNGEVAKLTNALTTAQGEANALTAIRQGGFEVLKFTELG